MIRSKLALALALSTALTSIAVSAQADEGFQAGSILIRARGVGVLPQVGTGAVNGAAAEDLQGLQATIDSVGIPEVDGSYFFTPNVAVELIAATFRTGIGSNVGSLGNTWVLPPTLTAQWHFNPKGDLVPYLGAGLNYTFFYNSTGAGSVLGNLNRLHLTNSVGYALQAGADYHITGNWYANVDVKYIFLSTDAGVGGDNLANAHVTVNPLLIGAGVGYKF